MKPLLLTVGNIYIDHNVFGVSVSDGASLDWGKDYFAVKGERVLGGSAINVAMQAHRLGVDVGFVGKTGTDSGAKEVRDLLDAQGINGDLIGEDAKHETSMAVNLIDKNGEFVGAHYGKASMSLTAKDIDINHSLFARCNAVYFGGTAKQPLLFGSCAELFGALTQRKIKVFYDPNRFPPRKSYWTEV